MKTTVRTTNLLALLALTISGCAPASAPDRSALRPYLVLAQESDAGTMLHFIDSETLADIGVLRVSEPWVFLFEIIAAPDGRTLFFSESPGGQMHQFALDLTARAKCLLTQQARVLSAEPGGQRLILESVHTPLSAGSGNPAAPFQPALEIWDAQTLTPEQTVPLPGDAPFGYAPFRQFFVSADGQRLYSLSRDQNVIAFNLFDVDAGRFVEQLRLPASSEPGAHYRAAWGADGSQFYVIDGERLFVVDAQSNAIERETPIELRGPGGPEPNTDGTWLEIAGVRDGRVMLYHPLGPYWIYDYEAEARGEISGGLFVVNAQTGEQVAHWHPSIAFTHAVAGGDRLYGVEMPHGLDAGRDPDNQLVMLDAETGELMASSTLEPGRWTPALVMLDPAAVPASEAPLSIGGCSRPEPTAIPFTPPAPPPTATPAK